MFVGLETCSFIYTLGFFLFETKIRALALALANPVLSFAVDKLRALALAEISVWSNIKAVSFRKG